MSEQLDDFIKYSKDVLGLEFYVDENEKPDTVEDIFGDMFFQSEACKHCGNNPKNGGSGVCMCILGTPKVT